jgi:hypothetical protein
MISQKKIEVFFLLTNLSEKRHFICFTSCNAIAVLYYVKVQCRSVFAPNIVTFRERRNKIQGVDFHSNATSFTEAVALGHHPIVSYYNTD